MSEPRTTPRTQTNDSSGDLSLDGRGDGTQHHGTRNRGTGIEGSRGAALRVAVIGGGANDEHSVSLASAHAVAQAIRGLGHEAVPLTIAPDGGWHDALGGALASHEAVAELGRCDLAFPALHGVNGEDGAIAGLLGLCGVRFAGSPVRAGALAMDKHATKALAASLGVATACGTVVLADYAKLAGEGISGLRAPFVVKPATGGSSNGVFVAREHAELDAAIAEARAFGDPVLVEEYVTGRELDIAVFRDRGGELRFGAPLEIGVTAGGVFGAAEKYDGSASFSVPAAITGHEATSLRDTAALLYIALGCAGVARFDFFLTPQGLVLNEVNTSPGMTERSQVPLMYAATGLSYAELISELIAASLAPGSTA